MISVIGAGPAGSYAAYLFAKEGHKVNLFEDHKEIGEPIACTGILTPQIEKVIKLSDEFHINTCTKTRVYAPNGKYIDIKIKKNPIFHRAKFDKFVAQMAVDAGAKLHLKHKFIGVEGKKIKVNDEYFTPDYLIGADGPGSAVAKSAGIYGERKFTIGMQARVKTKCDPDLVEFWLGVGQFAWLVPEDDTFARIGVASYKDAGKDFKKLMKLRCPNGKLLGWQSGLIPMYDHKLSIQKDNVRILGDAATQVKPTTYGGILFGMLAAKEMVKDIDNYEKNFKKDLGRELNLSFKIRKILDKFTEEDYNELVGMCEKDKVKEILEKHDRDYPSKMLFKLMVAQPSFLKFMKKLI